MPALNSVEVFPGGEQWFGALTGPFDHEWPANAYVATRQLLDPRTWTNEPGTERFFPQASTSWNCIAPAVSPDPGMKVME